MDGVALYHLTDVQLGNTRTSNIMCIGSNTVDLQTSYHTVFQKTSNLTTFMQVGGAVLQPAPPYCVTL